MTFGTLALLVAAGLVGPLLSSLHRWMPPAVVGEIAAGLVIGKAGFGLIDAGNPTLGTLSNVGLAMLMFIVGTHLPLRDPALRPALGRGALTALTAGILAIGTGLLLAPHVGYDHAFVLAVLIATSSGAVVLPILQAAGRKEPWMLVAMSWVAIADVVTVLSIPLVIATGAVLHVLAGGAIVIAAAVTVYFLLRASLSRHIVRSFRGQSRSRGWALDLRVSILILFTLAWAATRFGTSVLISGFAAGAVVALLGEPRRVAQQLIGLGEGFFVPIFFVALGARLDLGALVHAPRTLTLAAAVFGGSVVTHVVAARIWRLPLGAGLLSTAQLGVPSAIVSIGLVSHSLSAAQGSAIMAAVLASLAACALGAALVGRPMPITDHAAPDLAHG
jgi:Kef-type K+ transport system membrane component KefB